LRIPSREGIRERHYLIMAVTGADGEAVFVSASPRRSADQSIVVAAGCGTRPRAIVD
jgi:hypothetical protein